MPGMSFEEAVARLEAIVQQLESGGENLEQSLALFEEGIRLSRRCEEILQQAEGRIEELIGEAEQPPPGELFSAGGEG